MSILLTAKDLQQQLQVGRDKAYALMHAKGFPAMKLGGRYYVSANELDKWLERCAHKSFTL